MVRDGHFSDRESSRDCAQYSRACAVFSGESVVSPVVFRASHDLPRSPHLLAFPLLLSCDGGPCSPSDPAVLPLPRCLCACSVLCVGQTLRSPLFPQFSAPAPLIRGLPWCPSAHQPLPPAARGFTSPWLGPLRTYHLLFVGGLCPSSRVSGNSASPGFLSFEPAPGILQLGARRWSEDAL